MTYMGPKSCNVSRRYSKFQILFPFFPFLRRTTLAFAVSEASHNPMSCRTLLVVATPFACEIYAVRIDLERR
jgi:hypothetical protein